VRAVVNYAMEHGPEGYYFGDMTSGQCMRILFGVETEGEGKEKYAHSWQSTRKAVGSIVCTLFSFLFSC